MRFSANLGFLWADRPLPDAISAAKSAGYDAVECHWPYGTPASETLAALRETDLAMLGLNTPRGNVEIGENGLAALPGREVEARAAVDEALAYARETGTGAVHVMAGNCSGPRARAAFVENLGYACREAARSGITILIEPLNPRDGPGYCLADMPTALRVIEATDGAAKVMFDCYHMQIVHGDLLRTVERHLSAIGHVQFAAVPDRAEPDHGEVDYGWLLPAIAGAGYAGAFGAEYRPQTNSFEWMKRFAWEKL